MVQVSCLYLFLESSSIWLDPISHNHCWVSLFLQKENIPTLWRCRCGDCAFNSDIFPLHIYIVCGALPSSCLVCLLHLQQTAYETCSWFLSAVLPKSEQLIDQSEVIPSTLFLNKAVDCCSCSTEPIRLLSCPLIDVIFVQAF